MLGTNKYHKYKYDQHGSPIQRFYCSTPADGTYTASLSWVSGVDLRRFLQVTDCHTLEVLVRLSAIVVHSREHRCWRWRGAVAFIAMLYSLRRGLQIRIMHYTRPPLYTFPFLNTIINSR